MAENFTQCIIAHADDCGNDELILKRALLP